MSDSESEFSESEFSKRSLNILTKAAALILDRVEASDDSREYKSGMRGPNKTYNEVVEDAVKLAVITTARLNLLQHMSGQSSDTAECD